MWVRGYPPVGTFVVGAQHLMKPFLVAAIVVVSLIGSTRSGFSQQPSNVPSQAGALRVNTPKANERLAQTFVHVSYQLVNRSIDPASSPNFTVQLDGNDPITTAASDYTFTGLAPGAHTVTVTLVDANGVPIANSSVSTKFTVTDGTKPNRSPSSLLHPDAGMQIASNEILPDGGTPLPLLSLVGFVALVGGICTPARQDGK